MQNNFITIIRVIFASVIALFALSCRPCKELGKEVIIKDSISYKTEIRYRDSIYRIPADTAAIKALVKCDSLGRANMAKITKRSERAVITAEIKNGIASLNCICPEIERKLRIKEIENTILKNRLEQRSKTVQVKEPLSGIQQFLIYTGGLLWIIVIVLGSIFIYKIFN